MTLTSKIVVLLSFVLISLGATAQEKKVVRLTKKKFDQYSFIDARQAYIRVVEKGYISSHLLQKLADSYYFTSDYVNAKQWYKKLYELKDESTPVEYLYRYALTLKTLEQYSESDKIMNEFYLVAKKDVRANLFLNDRNYLEEIEANSTRFKLKNEDFNSELSDHGPAFYGDELVISTNRKRGVASHRIHSWNNQPFLDLMVVNPTEENAEVKNFDREVNSKFHESTPVFTKDKKTVFFTRNNYTDSNKKRDNQGTNHLKLYRADQNDQEKWEVTELPFNSDNYSVAHPALSVDEKTLYFASDMPGGFGKSDLYMATLDGETYGEPINLGKGINTEGRETFPFISSDKRMYFASNGHLGLGGLDVFVVKMYTHKDFSEVYNVGKPVNGPFDDFTFIINNETKKGYFASNRIEGKGDDDIYSLIETKELVISCKQVFEGTLKDESTFEPTADAIVYLLNEKGNAINETQSNAQGKFTFDIECGKQYSVRYKKKGFNTNEKPFNTNRIDGEIVAFELLIKKGKDLQDTEFKLGDDLNKILSLDPIYFDFNKSVIRPDAEIELQKVIAVMEAYPTLKIDVRSHTDSRAADDYNIGLSDRRNKSTIAYLIEKGAIKADRLTGRGYGEKQLINKCSNGVPCTRQEHQLNRRSEFIIISK